MRVSFDYDSEARALYVRLREGAVARTVEEGQGIAVDLDKDGNLLGVEVFFLGELSRVPSILTKYRAPAAPVDFRALGIAIGA